MTISGNRNGMTSTVVMTCRTARADRLRASNMAPPLPVSADGHREGADERQDQQHDGQRRSVADVRRGNTDPVDVRAEEFGGVVGSADGDEVGDVEGLQRPDDAEHGEGDRRSAYAWPHDADKRPD